MLAPVIFAQADDVLWANSSLVHRRAELSIALAQNQFNFFSNFSNRTLVSLSVGSSWSAAR